MSTTQIAGGIVVAVFVFWVVGAYNRIVRLRSDVVGRFTAVDAQCRQRHDLLQTQLGLLATVLAAAAPRLEALRAACLQADAAREHARAAPGAANAVTSLRVAEEILADARSRLPVQAAAGVDLPAINARLAESDGALAFARREFNESVRVYNEAVRQFPTVLVATLFGMTPAAIL